MTKQPTQATQPAKLSPEARTAANKARHMAQASSQCRVDNIIYELARTDTGSSCHYCAAKRSPELCGKLGNACLKGKAYWIVDALATEALQARLKKEGDMK